MLIIGCDFHTRYQQIAMLDEATGEWIEKRRESGSSDGSSTKTARLTASTAACRGRKRSRGERLQRKEA